MGDLNRLHSSEIDNGNVIDADHLNAEFNQLMNETNDQDDRLDVLEAGATSNNPTGAIIWYAGSSAPSGYLLCYGQAVSRTTYSALFAVVSTTYGSGDGSTTFNVPDVRGRVALGKDDMGGSAASRVTSSSTNGANSTTLGGAGGAQTHTLTVSELADHDHDLLCSVNGGSGASTSNYVGSNSDWNAATTTTNTVTIDGTGGGSAHSNTQPWLALNALIKT